MRGTRALARRPEDSSRSRPARGPQRGHEPAPVRPSQPRPARADTHLADATRAQRARRCAPRPRAPIAFARHDPEQHDHYDLARFPRLSPSPATALPRCRSIHPHPLPHSSCLPTRTLPLVPSRLAAAPPPAFHHHAWAGLPGFLWQVEEGGSSAKRWTPLPRKPRRKAKSGPEAGRRPVRLLRRTPRDEHQEPNTQRRTV